MCALYTLGLRYYFTHHVLEAVDDGDIAGGGQGGKVPRAEPATRCKARTGGMLVMPVAW